MVDLSAGFIEREDFLMSFLDSQHLVSIYPAPSFLLEPMARIISIKLRPKKLVAVFKLKEGVEML